VADHARRVLQEASNSDGGLGVTYVDECDDTLVLWVKVSLAEEAVLECECSGLINDTLALEAGNLGSVQQRLSLHIRAVGGNAQHDLLARDFTLLVVLSNLREVEGENLLDGELVFFVHGLDLEGELLVVEVGYVVCDESLLKFDLLGALLVEAQEAAWEHDRVLHVLTDLELDWVTHNALLPREGHLNRGAAVSRIVQHNVDAALLDDSHNSLG